MKATGLHRLDNEDNDYQRNHYVAEYQMDEIIVVDIECIKPFCPCQIVDAQCKRMVPSSVCDKADCIRYSNRRNKKRRRRVIQPHSCILP